MNELPLKLQQALDEAADIGLELTKMLEVKNDDEMLNLAHRIVAKIKIKNDIVFDLSKVLRENK